LAVAGVVSTFAAAQDKPRSRVTVVVKAPSAGASASTATAPTVKRAPSASGQPLLRRPLSPLVAGRDPLSLARSLAALVAVQSAPAGGPAPLRGLNPPSALAQAAQCRAQCAESRYVCTAREAGDCDTVWGACVVGCSGATYKETPDLVQRSTTAVAR